MFTDIHHPWSKKKLFLNKKKSSHYWVRYLKIKNPFSPNLTLVTSRRRFKILFWTRPSGTKSSAALKNSVLDNLKFYESYSVFWKAVWVSSFQKSLVHFFTLHGAQLINFSQKWRPLTPFLTPSKQLLTPAIYSFLCFYKNLLLYNSLKFGQFMYHKQTRPSSLFDHHLYLTFSPNRFYANLRDKDNLNYFSLSVGLFLKFFNQQKSLKKTKTFRFLLVKFLRKLLIVSGIRQFTIFFKRPPILLAEIFRFLTSPLITPFQDPVSEKMRVEDEKQFTRFSFKYFFFLKTIPYTTMKGKQKGRLKRKISKKIIKRNRISDEA